MKRALAQRGDWLLIFDNVSDPDSVKDYLPSLPTGRKANKHAGRVLLTSRNAKVASLGQVVDVTLFSREDAATFLLERRANSPLAPSGRGAGGEGRSPSKSTTPTSAADRDIARELAKELGDLPLALAQAAAFMSVRQVSLAEYLQLARAKLVELLKRGEAHDYPATVATTWELSFQEIERQSPAAADLLRLLSFFAPDRIPRWLLTESTAFLPNPLSETVADLLAWLDTIELLRSYSLIDQDDDSVSVHRLVQAVSRDRMSRERQIRWVGVLQDLLLRMFQRDIQVDVPSWRPLADLANHAEAISRFAEELDAATSATATLLNQLAVFQQVQGDYFTATSNIQHALAIDENVSGPNHPDVARDLVNLASSRKATNQLAEAESLLRRGLSIAEKCFGSDHPDLAPILNNFATLLHDTRRYDEAESIMRQTLAIAEQSFGTNHPTVATYLNNLASLLFTTKRMAEAIGAMKRALAIDEKYFGASHPNTARDLSNLAQFLKRSGNVNDAEPLMRRALAIDEASFGPIHPRVAIRLNNLANLLVEEGRLKEAEPLLRRAVAIEENSFGRQRPNFAVTLNNLAMLLQSTDRLVEAESILRLALEIDMQVLGAMHPNVAIRLNNLAMLLQATNRRAEAEPLMRRHVEIFQSFARQTGHEHPHWQAALRNYFGVLKAMELDDDEIARRMAPFMPLE